jgi:phytoene synthase
MSPAEYCQNKAARQGTSLYYSLLFLPENQQRAVTALYAYQKEINDTVAECADIGVAQTKLQWWQEEIARLFAGHPRHPVSQSLAHPIRIYELPQEAFLKVIEGASSDLGQFTYPSFQALVSYCYQVAGVISLMATEIYSYRDPRTRKYAEQLGIALQLTHILRNIRQDSDRGRIYLPQDELALFKVSAEDILTGSGNFKDISALFAHQASRVRQYFCSALAELSEHDYYSQRAGLTQAALCLNILEAIKEEGYPLLQQQIALTPLRKLWIAWRTSRRSQRGLIPRCQ